MPFSKKRFFPGFQGWIAFPLNGGTFGNHYHHWLWGMSPPIGKKDSRKLARQANPQRLRSALVSLIAS